MEIVLKGIELENFKSYANKQYIQFSDLSVLLGANSSGKSTALQALLMLKQTMECNSPSQLQGSYHLKGNPFWLLDRDDEKRNNLTQLKYALDFYNIFYTDIISKIFFVGPIRETPKGLYNIGFETVPKYVGPTGSYFASVLLHENKKEKI